MIGSNSKKAREMMTELCAKLNDRFPGHFEMLPGNLLNFIDLGSAKGNYMGYYRRPRIIAVEYNFPYVERGFRVQCANGVIGDKQPLNTFEDLCSFIQSNI